MALSPSIPVRLAALSLFAAYVLAAHWGLSLAQVNPSASAVWPPSGIALAAVLLLGSRAAAGVFAAALWANLDNSGSWPLALGIAAGNALEAWLGARLVNRYAGACAAFERPGTVLRFFALAAVLAPMASATLGLGSLLLAGRVAAGTAPQVWATWWLGDMAGVMTVAPFVLSWAAKPGVRWEKGQALEVAALFSCLILLCLAVFGNGADSGIRVPASILFPFLIWPAFALDQRFTSLATLVVLAFSVWGTLNGMGPFSARYSPNEALLYLQTFLAMCALTGLAVSSIVAQNEKGEAELRRMQEKLVAQREDLKASNAELDQFASAASHDLIAPLRGVENLVQWIGDDLGPEPKPEIRENLQLLRQRVRRMGRLLQDLLEYSRVGQQHAVVEVDLNQLAAEILETLGPKPGFQVKLLGPLPRLKAAKPPLKQVLMNLVSNALKHHDKPNGVVELSAVEKTGGVEIVVRDDGPGIAPQHHERIFSVFQTLQPRDRVEGSGLGLALVKRILESRGGSIRVDSDAGKGATFTVWWPQGT
jgi:signal transduction histidine kinase